MSDLILDVEDSMFEEHVFQSDVPVLVGFWAPWCGPCRSVAPVLEKFASQYVGRLMVVKYNVDQSEDSYKRFKIRGVPTLVAVRDGKEISRCAGVTPGTLSPLLDALLSAPASGTIAGSGTYGGDPDRKARCIKRIALAIENGHLVNAPENQTGAFDGAALPSVIASREIAPTRLICQHRSPACTTISTSACRKITTYSGSRSTGSRQFRSAQICTH